MKALKVLLFILAFSFLSSKAYAQQEIDACWNYINAQDYQRAIKAGKKAVSKYPRNFDAHLCLGAAYSNTGQLDLALDTLKNAEKLAEDKKQLALVYQWLGSVYSDKRDLDKALYYSLRSLSLYRDLGDIEEEAAQLNSIAMIYRSKGDLDKALSYFKEALSITTDEKAKATIYSNIGVIYDDKGDYESAVSYYKKAIEIGERTGDYQGVAQRMLNLGDVYREMGDFNSAKKYLLEGLRRIKIVGDKYWEAAAYGYLALLYRDKGDKNLAKDYLTKACSLYKSIGAEKDAVVCLLKLQKLQNLK